jgi:hypothetical protein
MTAAAIGGRGALPNDAAAGNELCAILPLSRKRESARVPDRVPTAGQLPQHRDDRGRSF